MQPSADKVTHELRVGQAVYQCVGSGEVRGWLALLAKIPRNLTECVTVENVKTGRAFTPGTLAECVALGIVRA